MSSTENQSGFIPRKGQKELYNHLTVESPGSVNIRWPGGYGKSIGIALGYKWAKESGVSDRLLIVVANDTQRKQVLSDFSADADLIGLSISGVWEFTKEPMVYRASKTGKAEVFVATIHAVSATNRAEQDTLLQLLRTGSFMLAADEYHHYAEGFDWGESIKRIMNAATFTLATSATPDRDFVNTVFGDPNKIVSVSFRDALDEVPPALKNMSVTHYHYHVEMLDRDDDVVTFTTDQLRECAGDASRVSKWETQKELRYSGRYIMPVLLRPLTRLVSRRLKTGQPLQCLIRAMSCNHAQMLYKQVKEIAEGLTVDWIGTGINGRTEQENDEVKRRFCPEKNGNGGRHAPELDVLVQVGMAGEGFDTIYVAEIIDLAVVAMEGTANNTAQFLLRGSRAIPAIRDNQDPEIVREHVCYINVPSDHPLAGIGKNIVEWLDDPRTPLESLKNNPDECDVRDGEFDMDAVPEIPDLPAKDALQFVSLINVTRESEEFLNFVKNANTAAMHTEGMRPWNMSDEQDIEAAMDFFKVAYKKYEEKRTDQAYYDKLRDKIDIAIGQLARLVVMSRNRGSVITSELGSVKKKINSYFKGRYGERKALLDELELIYRDIQMIESVIREGDYPVWLR